MSRLPGDAPKVLARDTDAILSVENLTHAYGLNRGAGSRAQQSYAVESVSFDVRRGTTLAVIGETGSGKSTLARAVIQQPPPSSGSVWYNGNELTKLKGAQLSAAVKGIGVVFQDAFSSLDPRWTIFNLVAEPLRFSGLSRRLRRERVRELLDFVGLDPSVCERERAGSLSGGQCQRAAIARAMASDPLLLIADEPTSALDVSVQAQIVNLLLRLQQEFKLAMLFISHDLSVVRHLSHEVVVMYGGHVCEIGPTPAILEDPLHPYSAGLLSTMPGSEKAAQWMRFRPAAALSADTPDGNGCWYRAKCPSAQAECALAPSLATYRDGRQAACHRPIGAITYES